MAKRRKHWTQTAEGRKRLSEQGKAWHRHKRRSKKDGSKVSKAPEVVANSFAVGFAAGTVSEWVSNFASSNHIPRSEVAEGVAKVLRGEEGW